MTARVEKFLAAKAAGSETGRKQITGLLGDSGEKLVILLHTFTTNDVGKEKAAYLEECLFKIVAKFVVFIREGKVKLSDFSVIVVPTRTLVYSFVDALEMTSVCYDAKQISAGLKVVTDHLSLLLKPLITGKSLERIEALNTYWGSKATLDKIMKTEDAKDQLRKGEFSDLVQSLLKDLEVKREEPHEKEEKKEEKAEKKEEKKS